MKPPFVSVIVPCRNEASFIDRCLISILSSDYPRDCLEIVVADGMSTDGTRVLLAAHAARNAIVRVIDNPERLTPIALNRAIAASRGEIIVRFDGHAVMPRDYICRLVDLLLSSNADNAGGSIRTVTSSAKLFSGPIAAALSSRFGVGDSCFRTASGESGARPADTVFGGCWRRELFSRLGGFQEQLARGQDMEFNLRIRRAGGVIVLDPSIVCDYFAPPSLSSFIRHSFRNGVWAILPFAVCEIIPVRARHLVPLAFVLALALSLMLPFPWSIALAAIYALANLAVSACISYAVGKASYLLRMPAVFLSLHLAYGIGGAWACLKLACSKLEGHPKHATRIET